MSNQLVCDVDGTFIDVFGNEFYTVTEGKGGGVKHICYECARSLNAAWWVPWTATTEKVLADRVRPSVASGASNNGWAYDVITPGITGDTEPTWPTTISEQVVDGTVTYVTNRAPGGNVRIYNELPNTTPALWSLWGWMTDANELSA